MAKKFGKFVLFTAAAAAACAGIYYYFQNKDKFSAKFNGDEDEDYDDFSEDLDDADANRSYVPLSHENTSGENTDASAEGSDKEEAPFEKLSSLVADTAKKAEEKVEEFFDEDDEASSEQ